MNGPRMTHWANGIKVLFPLVEGVGTTSRPVGTLKAPDFQHLAARVPAVPTVPGNFGDSPQSIATLGRENRKIYAPFPKKFAARFAPRADLVLTGLFSPIQPP